MNGWKTDLVNPNMVTQLLEAVVTILNVHKLVIHLGMKFLAYSICTSKFLDIFVNKLVSEGAKLGKQLIKHLESC